MLKIAIYSGSIPTTTFIENLIEGVSAKHRVYLFGKKRTAYKGKNKNYEIYPTYHNKLINLFITGFRSVLLLIRFPKRFYTLLQLVTKFKSYHAKWNWWSRYLPVLLYLPDVFHIQWAKDIPYWMFLKEKFDCNIVLSLRGAHINYSPIANLELASTYNTYFPNIDAFHAVSDAIGLEAQKYAAAPNKITTIHSLVSQNTFDLFKLPKEKNAHQFNVISVGRHHWKKGYNIALDACKLLKEQGVLFNYTIVAAGKVPEEFIFQRHQLNLEKEVIFLDAMSQKNVFKKMQESDVLLLPSIEEGIANVVLEAMAIGVPVISADCGGMNEVVKDKETGWLVPVLNSEAISQALLEVKKTSLEKHQEIAKKACNLLKEEFNEAKGIEQFLDFYDKVYWDTNC